MAIVSGIDTVPGTVHATVRRHEICGLVLARTLDDIVQDGAISNENLLKVQGILKLIFQPQNDGSSPKKPPPNSDSTSEVAPSAAVHRQLNHIITSAIGALKEADPQQLFFLPVTDNVAALAPRLTPYPPDPAVFRQIEQ